MLGRLRLGVYTDYTYSLPGGEPHAERAFALFVDALAAHLGQVVVAGRLDPDGAARYPLASVEFVPLPHYARLTDLAALGAMRRSLRPLWRMLDEVDCVWVLGPHPLAVAFAVLARLRGRSVVLGVRQDMVPYMRSRHPGRRLALALGRTLDWGFRMLSRRFPVIVVGPALAKRYRGAGRRVLDLSISLVRSAEIVSPEVAAARSYAGELRALSVGRLEAEKNPLALADLLASLREMDDRWQLVVCGEGPMRAQLEARLEQLGVAGACSLRGYVPHDRGLAELYRSAHALAHVSWTEGLPQVLYEAFAAGLPVMATDVGGVAEAVGQAALLVPPGQPRIAAEALDRIGRNPELRRELIGRGVALAREHTLESETARAAEFILQGGAAPPVTMPLQGARDVDRGEPDKS